MIPSAPKQISKYIFPEDASQFLASECDQSHEETIKKEPDNVVGLHYKFSVSNKGI